MPGVSDTLGMVVGTHGMCRSRMAIFIRHFLESIDTPVMKPYNSICTFRLRLEMMGDKKVKSLHTTEATAMGILRQK